MISRAFLASKYWGGLSQLVPDGCDGLSAVFVPTAGSAYSSAPWISTQRTWLERVGLRVTDLELATASAREAASAMRAADLVCIAGGNTYYLLHHMQRTEFRKVLLDSEVVYAGISAGAIVLGPDVGYIEDMDERVLAPELADTTGLGLVDFRILPHMDDLRVRNKLDRILAKWPTGWPLIKLNDDEAVLVDGEEWKIVPSPAGDLL